MENNTPSIEPIEEKHNTPSIEPIEEKQTKDVIDSNNTIDEPNIFLWIPNILDYLRVVFAVFGFLVGRSYPILFLLAYFISFSLDLFDGMAARHFDQCSRLGATLDMVIDRVSTAGLLMLISQLIPDYSVIFILLMMLDVGSHWLQTHSALIGRNLQTNINHKSLKEDFFIVRLYYTNKYCLFIVCLFAELFLLLIYWKGFYAIHFESILMNLLLFVSFIIYSFKQYVSVIQMISAAKRIVVVDLEEYNQRKDKANK